MTSVTGAENFTPHCSHFGSAGLLRTWVTKRYITVPGNMLRTRCIVGMSSSAVRVFPDKCWTLALFGFSGGVEDHQKCRSVYELEW